MVNAMQVGISPITYYSGYSPFLNWARKSPGAVIQKTTFSRISFNTANVEAGYFDADGNVAANAPSDTDYVIVIFHAPSGNPGEDMTGEDFTYFYEGNASDHGGLSITNMSTFNNTTKTGTFKGANSGCWLFLRIDPANRATPPKNIRIIQTRYLTTGDGTTVDGVVYPGWNDGGEFNPHWLHEMEKMRRLRLMDPMQTNNSQITTYSQIATDATVHWAGSITNENGEACPVAAMPLAAIGRIANLTGCEVHVCIPHQMNDAGVQAMATAMKNATTNKVWYEWSNEVWNDGFTQKAYANTHASDHGLTGPSQYTGYRAAECMKLIKDIYNDRTRWAGVWATQSGNVTVTTEMKVGFEKWKTDTGNSSYTPATLFDDLMVTSYFGEWIPSAQVNNLVKGTSTVFTLYPDDMGLFSVGDEIIVGLRLPGDVNTSGMGEIQGQYGHVTAKNTGANTITVDINSSGFSNWTFTGETFIAPTKYTRLLQQSKSLHGSDPTTYPTDYTYLNQQLRDLHTTGSNSFGMTASTGQVASINQWPQYWTAQKTLATSYGLELSQYEGGNQMVISTMLGGRVGLTPSQNPVGDPILELMRAHAHSEECARVYELSYQLFFSVGGTTPSKFYDAGQVNQYGNWASIRWWPTASSPSGDMANPVWSAVTRVSSGKRRLKLS